MVATNTSVLIIEDDDRTARQMQQIIQNDGYQVSIASTFATGLEAAKSSEFALILVDRTLPDGDGIEIIQQLRATGDQVLILIVSALGRSQNRIEGLNEGADDYLAKPFDPAELRARIKALLRRRAVAISSDVLIFGDLEIRKKARTVHRGNHHIAISPKEFELLLVFAAHAGEMLTRKMLLELVWNLHFDPQTNVVDVHVGRLRRKLEIEGRCQLIHTLRGKGYIFSEEVPLDMQD